MMKVSNLALKARKHSIGMKLLVNLLPLAYNVPLPNGIWLSKIGKYLFYLQNKWQILLNDMMSIKKDMKEKEPNVFLEKINRKNFLNQKEIINEFVIECNALIKKFINATKKVKRSKATSSSNFYWNHYIDCLKQFIRGSYDYYVFDSFRYDFNNKKLKKEKACLYQYYCNNQILKNFENYYKYLKNLKF